MGSYRMCVCFTRKYRITEAEPPSDVKDAFKKFSKGGNHMNADQLRQFLVEFQGDDATTVQDAQQIHHRRHHHHIPKFRRYSLTLDDFHHYLFSLDFNPPIMDKAVGDTMQHIFKDSSTSSNNKNPHQLAISNFMQQLNIDDHETNETQVPFLMNNEDPFASNSMPFRPLIQNQAPQMDLSINNAEAVLERFKAVVNQMPQSDRVYYNNVFRHLATSLEERQSQGGREEEPNR